MPQGIRPIRLGCHEGYQNPQTSKRCRKCRFKYLFGCTGKFDVGHNKGCTMDPSTRWRSYSSVIFLCTVKFKRCFHLVYLLSCQSYIYTNFWISCYQLTYLYKIHFLLKLIWYSLLVCIFIIQIVEVSTPRMHYKLTPMLRIKGFWTTD